MSKMISHTPVNTTQKRKIARIMSSHFDTGKCSRLENTVLFVVLCFGKSKKIILPRSQKRFLFKTNPGGVPLDFTEKLACYQKNNDPLF